ncbi:hypothetical protein ACFP1I_09640 [Dyadobacter subterraneus]|uniref:Uncharacterized protein n=1 Tax=Dyadobacter subterraneus TaxID=2773304 RepID=A0ABR9WE59_9BACT|nr:hypothetical protein [Dyadobacter subterraneus]MBE9462636.1 hypothetical protein [Dyadobacter subterraneus]
MIKKLRFILPLIIVLLSGYIQHGSRGYNESFFLSAIKDFEGSVFSSCVSLPVNQGFSVQSLPTDSENGNIKNHATAIEEKDEELVAFRKHLEFGNEFFTDLSTNVAARFRHFITHRIFFSKSFCYFPSYKALYLLLKVFRI